MQRKAGFGFGLGVSELRAVLAEGREAWALARPPTSCETLRKSFSVSGPQAFLPVGGREMPSSLSSPSATSEPLFNLLLASLI